MLRFCLTLFLVSAVFAETPPVEPAKAPPEVETALRARVSLFFQSQIQGKYYQAEQLVALDSKDFFVGSNKPNYLGFEIQSIQYEGNFTKATVLVRVNRIVPVEGFLGHPVPWSVPSRWKLENGLWCWYTNPDDSRATPFGTFPHGSTISSSPPPGLPGAMPGAMPGMPPGAGGQVTADKSAVELKAGEPSSDQVTIVNQMPMPVTLVLHYQGVPGFSVKLDRKSLRAGERAILTVQTTAAVKAPPQPITVSVRVEQTNQFIPIKVSFTEPAK